MIRIGRRRLDTNNTGIAKECLAASQVHVTAQPQCYVDVRPMRANLQVEAELLPIAITLEIGGRDAIFENRDIGAGKVGSTPTVRTSALM